MPQIDTKNIHAYWLGFVTYWGIVLFGYDTGIGGGIIAQDLFMQKYGLKNPDGTTNKSRRDHISAVVVSVLQAGAFFGALASAPVSARLGRKRTLLAFCTVFSVGAALQTALGGNRGLAYMYSGRAIAGFGIGGISAVAPTFVSECAPKEVRGRITGLFQIMVATGVMLSYWINLGASLYLSHSENVWRVPLGFQFVPAGFMLLGLLTVKESPRWLVSVGRNEEAIRNLAFIRRESVDSPAVRAEMAEIEAASQEELVARKGLGVKEAFFGKGNFIRFFFAFFIFFLQQFCGQNSVNYYAPIIFQSIGYTGTSVSLLASGIYGVMKVIATTFFIFVAVESLGRKLSLFISAIGMGILFFIVGALLKSFPPDPKASEPSPASQAMAAMLYIYVCFYSLGWGPLPWVYSSDIFPTRTRHYGLAVASASQWLWNFVVSYNTPMWVTNFGWKIFVMYATINVGAMGTFALIIPETKGRSLEEMDIIFDAVSAETRRQGIERRKVALGGTGDEGLFSTSSDSKVRV
ncbi:general substrate transporter [Thelephora ganbajun]|uniref:General substrate transporter n=1 Tax=Thelephora ganbajun TaxID=370292 RepID=A0ACB6ZSQ7_THEGA|nr:general substrate transporter [Thelephora ganbajun]